MNENFHDYAYLNVLSDILDHGEVRSDRTGVGTFSTFGRRMVFDLTSSFPLLTSKTLYTRAIFEELLWFLSGDTNNKTLNDKNVHIWDEWADPETGELGPIYGHQWRSWPGKNGGTIDQISNLIDGLINDPFSRRHIVSAWNPADISEMALPPCHTMFQFYVAPNLNGEPEGLSCQLYQRSGDMFLGVPFNIASYSLLTHMVAQQVGLKPLRFIHALGDAHIYTNHEDAVRKQLRRIPTRSPKLDLTKAPDIFSYTIDNINIFGYDPLPPIKASVAV